MRKGKDDLPVWVFSSYTLRERTSTQSPTFLPDRTFFLRFDWISDEFGSAIDPLHKWRLDLNNNTLYILSLILMFQDKGFFS